NKVSTSIFMTVTGRIRRAALRARRCPSTFGPFLDNLQRAALALPGRAHLQQRPDRVDRRALFADDLADIRGMHAPFINGHALLTDRSDVEGIGPIHQALDHVFKEGLHRSKRLQAAAGVELAAGAALAALRMKLATVSLGRAPFPIQYFARS